jgi:hypothetical protein
MPHSKDMKRLAKQQMLLQYVLDLAKSMKRDPREALGPFFKVWLAMSIPARAAVVL